MVTLAVLVAVAAMSAAIILGEAGLLVVEAEATEEATVRISAKRSTSGRTEFRLQVRTGGEWSEERLAPSRRYLSRTSRTNRWHQSGDLQLDSGHVVRIAAQRLENGQIEFALQEVVDGEVGERMLPESRLFPRSPTVGEWLNTSALVLADPNPEPRFTPLVGASGSVGTGIEYSSWYDAQGVHTSVRSRTTISQVEEVEADAEGGDEEADAIDLYLTQSCLNSQNRSLTIDGLPGSGDTILVMSQQDQDLVEVDLALDDGDAESQHWQLVNADGQTRLAAGDRGRKCLHACVRRRH